MGLVEVKVTIGLLKKNRFTLKLFHQNELMQIAEHSTKNLQSKHDLVVLKTVLFSRFTATPQKDDFFLPLRTMNSDTLITSRDLSPSHS